MRRLSRYDCYRRLRDFDSSQTSRAPGSRAVSLPFTKFDARVTRWTQEFDRPSHDGVTGHRAPPGVHATLPPLQQSSHRNAVSVRSTP
jgi:hypothetical protein